MMNETAPPSSAAASAANTSTWPSVPSRAGCTTARSMAAVQARPITMSATPSTRAAAVSAVRRLWRRRLRKARLKRRRTGPLYDRVTPMHLRAAITALGRYVPERVVSNLDLEKSVDTTDEWIRTRTGIRQRHRVEPGTPTSALALRACQDALRQRGIDAAEIDVIIVATVTPDMLFPATACILQDK